MPQNLKRDKNTTLRVMGIDPSTTNLGVAVIDICLTQPESFKLIHIGTLYGSKVIYDVPEQFDDTAGTGVSARSYCLARALGQLIDIYEPDTGICEDNFLGISALTFKQLVQVVSMVRESFNKRGVHLSYVLPNLAKAIVGANFKGTQKEDVKKGLISYDRLDANGFDLELSDEHSIDAGVVTLYRCEQIARDYGVYEIGRGRKSIKKKDKNEK